MTSAFSLVEVVLAIGIIAFALLPVFALFPVGINTTQDSVQQTESAHLVSLIEADIRAIPRSASSVSPVFGVPFSPSNSVGIFLNENGSGVDVSGARLTAQTAKYRATLAFGISQGRNATPLHILVTWPAAAPPGQAAGRFGAFTTLDRN